MDAQVGDGAEMPFGPPPDYRSRRWISEKRWPLSLTLTVRRLSFPRVWISAPVRI